MPEKRLRIVIGLQYYLPHRTGYSIYVQRIAEELVARGHQVTVLTARHKIDLPRDETINGVRIIRLWSPIRVSRGMVMLAYPWSMWGLLRQNEVVWLHLPMLETALTAFLAQLTGRGLVATHHGDLNLPEGGFNRFIERFIFELYAFMARRASRIIGYSHDYADFSYYLTPFRGKVSIIYPPILMPEPDAERVAELRAQWQLSDGPIIGYAGRFVQEKRPDVLIRALDTINKTYPNARIVFAGEYDIAYEDTWEENQYLVQQYQDQLIFLGLITSQQAMANFFGACDILVLSSDSECFGFVQVEAMLSGTPVVMTDIPGGRVPVRETGMGKLVSPGDSTALGQAVIEILEDPSQFARTRHEIEAAFNFDETVSRYEKHFRRARANSRWGKRYHADSD